MPIRVYTRAHVISLTYARENREREGEEKRRKVKTRRGGKREGGGEPVYSDMESNAKVI